MRNRANISKILIKDITDFIRIRNYVCKVNDLVYGLIATMIIQKAIYIKPSILYMVPAAGKSIVF